MPGANHPAVSVVMPLYNAAPYLDESVASIVAQSFQDLELVIVDDASTDGSLEMARTWARRDGRIRVLANEKRCGVDVNGTRAVQAARGGLCARMDADDVSHPDRLRAEYEVLRDRADVVLVATLAHYIDASGRVVRPRDRWRLVYRSAVAPFAHGSTMFRRDAFLALGGYREACNRWSDLDLYWRMSAHGRIVVLPEVLYRHRFHAASFSGEGTVDELARRFAVKEACIAARSAGGDDAAVLAAAAAENGAPSAAFVKAFQSVASRRIWAGHAPGVLRAVLAAKLPVSWMLARLIAVAACGAVSPRGVRFLLRSAVRTRDLAIGPFLPRGGPVEWRWP